MTEQATVGKSELLALTSEIVAAQVSNNATTARELPGLVQAVFDKLNAPGTDAAVPVDLTPAVPIRKSVADDFLVCLEDGRKLRMLKRHLMVAHGMAPEEYRERWGLWPDYPMVAAAYARVRQALAKKIGLGLKPVVEPPAPTPKPKGRRKKGTQSGCPVGAMVLTGAPADGPPRAKRIAGAGPFQQPSWQSVRAVDTIW